MNLKPFLALLFLSAACGTLPNPSVTPKHEEYSAPTHPAATAEVTLSASPENITLDAMTDGKYFDAKIDYIGTINYSANAANDRYSVTLTENANNLNYSGAPLNWSVGIDPATPLKLDVHSSSGALALNLNDFILTELRADTSSGSIDAHLPAADSAYPARVETSSGSVKLTAEDGANIHFDQLESSSGAITLNTGSGSSLTAAVQTSSGAVTVNGGTNAALNGSVSTSSGDISLNFAAESAVTLTLRTSSGDIRVTVPPDAAVKLVVEENSSGAVSVPDALARASGSERTGTWQTEGFERAARQIVITVTSSSSGDITVANS